MKFVLFFAKLVLCRFGKTDEEEKLMFLKMDRWQLYICISPTLLQIALEG